MNASNQYMQQVMAEQADIEEELKRRPRKRAMRSSNIVHDIVHDGIDLAGYETPAVDVRITGFWRWRNVIVPPNAYADRSNFDQRQSLICPGGRWLEKPSTLAVLQVQPLTLAVSGTT